MPSRRPSARLLALTLATALLAPAVAADGHAFDYRFAWHESAHHVDTEDGATREGRTTRVPVDASMSNLTVLRFLLSWEDEAGKGPATLEVVVHDPDGRERARVNETARNGSLEALARVQETPPGTVTLRADSDEEAWRTFHERYPPNRAGTGTWRVYVTVHDAGEENEGPLPVGERPERAWNLSVDAGAYRGVLENRAPVASDDEPPEKSPTEMPPPDEDDDVPPENETPDGPGNAPGNILQSGGAKSAVVLAGAIAGIASALYLSRRARG